MSALSVNTFMMLPITNAENEVSVYMTTYQRNVPVSKFVQKITNQEYANDSFSSFYLDINDNFRKS